MKSTEFLPETNSFLFRNHSKIILGSSFTSDIFYQLNNLILSNHMILNRENDECIVSFLDTGGECSDKKVLCYGDELKVYGLWIGFYGEFLFLSAFKGDIRIAKRSVYVS